MSSVHEDKSDESTLDLAGQSTAHAAGQASRSPSSVSGMSELAREAERLVVALDASDAQALAEAVQRSESPVAAKLRSYQEKLLPAVQHDPAPSARSGSSGISELARESEELLNAIHASAAAPLVDAVLQGEAPVAASLRRRLPEQVLRNSHLPMTSQNWPVPTGISDYVGRDGCSQSERPASRTRNNDLRLASGAEGEGNGGFEAMEGSMMEGSGRALIRNGRIHLLEWRPIGDRRLEYDDVAPGVCSLNSSFSELLYGSGRSDSSAEAGRRSADGGGRFSAIGGASQGPAAWPQFQQNRRREGVRSSRSDSSASVSFMDHVKVREAAREWLSAQGKIRSKLQELLPVPHGASTARVSAPNLRLSSSSPRPGPEKQEGRAIMDKGHEKGALERRLRLRNIWKGDLQTEHDGKISLEVLARVLRVPMPSKRLWRSVALTPTRKRADPVKKKRKDIHGGIYFPQFNTDLELPFDDATRSPGPQGLAVSDREGLSWRELSDVFKALDLHNTGRIEIRQFLDFIYDAPKKRPSSALPPRPRSAMSRKAPDENDKFPFKIDAAWERELKHVFRRHCVQGGLAGLDAPAFTKAIHEIGLAQDCVSGQGFEGVSVEDARHQFALSLQAEVTHGGSVVAQDSSKAFLSQARTSRSHEEAPSSASADDTAPLNLVQDNETYDEGEGRRREQGAGVLGGTVRSGDLKRAEQSIQGLMTFQQFLHAVHALVAKGGKIATSLVKSRMGDTEGDHLRASSRQADDIAKMESDGQKQGSAIHGDGDSEGSEGTSYGNRCGRMHMDDLRMPQRSRREEYFPNLHRSQVAQLASQNAQGQPWARDNGERVSGQARPLPSRRPSSAMGRLTESTSHGRDQHADLSEYFPEEDAAFLRSVARDEAVLLIRSAERQAREIQSKQVQARVDARGYDEKGSSMHMSGVDRHRNTPVAVFDKAMQRVYHIGARADNNARKNVAGESMVSLDSSGNVPTVPPGEKRMQWRPPSANRSRQAVRPSDRARKSVASLNEMMGRDPRAADCVSRATS